MDIVFDYRRVLAVNHEEALLDFDALNIVDEGRERIEPEFLEIAVPLRMYRAGILVGREIVTVAVDQQSFFELRKENHATHRRLRRCGQQAVISARVQADNAGGRKTTEAVGLQPLQLSCLIEIPADVLIDADHAGTSSRASSCT